MPTSKGYLREQYIYNSGLGVYWASWSLFCFTAAGFSCSSLKSMLCTALRLLLALIDHGLSQNCSNYGPWKEVSVQLTINTNLGPHVRPTEPRLQACCYSLRVFWNAKRLWYIGNVDSNQTSYVCLFSVLAVEGKAAISFFCQTWWPSKMLKILEEEKLG